MNYPPPQNISRETPSPAPYQDLFIYYLKGRAKESPGSSDGTFIGTWIEDEYSFLFFSRPSPDTVSKILSLHPHLTLLDTYHMTYDEWQGGTLSPIRSGRFTIIPPWKKTAITSTIKEQTIILDPGVVFGNGNHPTTQSCLEALEFAFRYTTFESALDLGTGTGLLALAAARLNCKKILAVDFNYLAVNTAHRNIRLNRLEEKILAVQGRAENFIDFSSDLLITNIHYDVLKSLIASKGFFAKKGFILSGLLRSQAREILSELSKNSVEIVKIWDHEGVWHTFLGKKS